MSTSNIKGVVSLKSIVSNVLLDLGKDGDMGEYLRYLNWGIRVLKELNLFHVRVVQTIQLSMTDIKTVTLPDDFLMFVSLGIPVNGRMWYFTKDDKLIMPQSEECALETLEDDDGEGVVIGDGRDYYGYGLPGGRNEYYYRLDLPNNRIVVNGFPRSKVILTYVGTGIKMGEETMVLKVMEEALIAGIHNMRDRRDRSVPMNHKIHSEEIYNQEVEKLRFVQGPTLDEICDAIYKTYYQSIKR